MQNVTEVLIHNNVTILYDTCQRVTIFKLYTLGFMEIRVSKIPPVCMVGVGEDVGSDSYLSHGLLVWISFKIMVHINFNE